MTEHGGRMDYRIVRAGLKNTIQIITTFMKKRCLLEQLINKHANIERRNQNEKTIQTENGSN